MELNGDSTALVVNMLEGVACQQRANVLITINNPLITLAGGHDHLSACCCGLGGSAAFTRASCKADDDQGRSGVQAGFTVNSRNTYTLRPPPALAG